LKKVINAAHRKSLANGLEYGVDDFAGGVCRFLQQSFPQTDIPAVMKREFVTLSPLYVSHTVPLVGWCASPEETVRRQAVAAAIFYMCNPQFIITFNLSFLVSIWVYLMLSEP